MDKIICPDRIAGASDMLHPVKGKKTFWALRPRAVPASVCTKDRHQMVCLVFPGTGYFTFKIHSN